MKIAKIYKEFIANQNRYAILYGGAGSGKSYSIAQKFLIRLVSEENHRFLIVRKVAKTLRHSVFSLFVSIISKEGLSSLFAINKTDMTIEFKKNGNKLLFLGLMMLRN